MSKRTLIPVAILGIATFMGCTPTSPKPILYPAAKSANPANVNADLAECEAMANQYVADPSFQERAGKAAKEGLWGGAVGAGTGAVAGTIMGGSVGRATAAGAAGLAMINIANSIRESGQNPTRERFLERCLEERGHKVIGWEKPAF